MFGFSQEYTIYNGLDDICKSNYVQSAIWKINASAPIDFYLATDIHAVLYNKYMYTYVNLWYLKESSLLSVIGISDVWSLLILEV